MKVWQCPKSVKLKKFKLSKALGTHNNVHAHLLIFSIQGTIFYSTLIARRGKEGQILPDVFTFHPYQIARTTLKT